VPLRNRIFAGATLLAALAVVLWCAPSVPTRGGPDAILGARVVPYVAGGIALVTGVALVLPRFGPRLALIPLLIVGVAQVAHLHWSAADRLVLNKPLDTERERRYLARLPDHGPQWRVGIDGPRVGFGNRELLRYAGGYRVPMQLRRQARLLRWLGRSTRRLQLFNVRYFRSRSRPGGGARPLGGGLWETPDPVPLVVHYRAVERIADGAALKRWSRAHRAGRALVEQADWTAELERLHGAGGPRTTGVVVAYGNNEITAEIAAPTRGLVVFNEVYFPGWRATVDGTERRIHRCNHLLRGVAVEPGKHLITLEYWPAGYGWLLALLLFAIAGTVGLALARRLDREPADRPRASS
jgi:hypothetical protein